MRGQFHRKSALLGLGLLVCLMCHTTEYGQDSEGTRKPPTPPSEELFKARDGLASPWRDSGCHRTARAFREAGCRLVTGDDWKRANVLTLYNPDGTIWYRFFLSSDYSVEYLANRKDGFDPYAVPYRAAIVVLFRTVSESEHWLEVEVNEKTRQTKFVSKQDPMWGTTSYGYWLAESGRIKLDETQHLKDKPEGKVISGTKSLIDEGFVRKIDGDWALVEEVLSDGAQAAVGWIRWKEGRELLVGCLLNGGQVPTLVKKKSPF